ncbi:MAG: aryl-sulfate sulfotransferase [Lachnospiraceae bacterium]|nr:aryl-sulfate sulfotransferase [Lachnospiraceae bacterium]
MASTKGGLLQTIRKKIRKNKFEVKGNKFFKKAYEYYESQNKYNFDANFSIDSNILLRVNSNTVRSFIIDVYIEHLLDENTYTLNDPFIEVDPYNAAPLSALVAFNTKNERRFSYTVKGQNGSPDFTLESKIFTKRQRIPVVGLYDGAQNQVVIRLYDKNGKQMHEHEINIKTKSVDEVLKNKLTSEKEQKLKIGDGEFLLITGGFGGTTCGFDNNYNLRFALSKAPHPYGISLLRNGRFLYAEREMRRPNYGNAHSVIVYQMDFLGRSYITYKMKKGTHHWATDEEDSGKLLLDSSSYDDGHLENMVTEIDPENGKILRNFSMNDFFDDTYTSWHDWAHINSFHYIPGSDDMVVSCRNIHTIARLDLKNKKIKWIFTNPEFYKGTDQESLCLKPVGDIDWFFQQHGVNIIKNDPENGILQIVFLDNHTANRRPVDWFDGVKESYVIVAEINEKEGTVKQLKRFKTELSITRSNALVYKDFKTVFGMCGNLADHVPGKRAKIFEFDYETGEQLDLITCKRDFFASHIIEFDVDSMTSPLEITKPRIYGSLVSPEKVKKLPKLMRMSNQVDQINKIKFRIFDNILQIRAKDHRVKKVYLYNRDNKYMIDFTDTKQESKIFKKQSYFISIPLEDLENGRYKIGIKFRKEFFKTPFTITKNK